MGAALRVVYERAVYRLSIDYARPPVPPLAETDRAWAEALVRER